MPVHIDEITTQVHSTSAARQLSPEQLRVVVEKVYAMLLNELRIEAERKLATPPRYWGAKARK